MSETAESFACTICGKTHAGLPTDTGYTLPDEVWAISEDERAAQAKWTTDLCQWGDRYFIRCVLKVPFLEQTGYYGWGVWAEVEHSVFQRYLELYEKDATGEPAAIGKIANEIPTYDGAKGLPVYVQFASSTERPTLIVINNEAHKLAREARDGISRARFHEILAARLHLD